MIIYINGIKASNKDIERLFFDMSNGLHVTVRKTNAGAWAFATNN